MAVAGGSCGRIPHVGEQTPNLHIVTEALVRRVLFADHRAVGIETVQADRTVVYAARTEVILSAGTIMSPKLLQLSGIGSAEHLASLGIPVIVDRPGVGAHMHEHKIISMQVRLTKPYSHNRRLQGRRMLADGARYLLTHRGVLATTYDLDGFIKTDPDLDHPMRS